MLIHPWDASSDDGEWQAFVDAQGFGQLIASGRDREVPVAVPTQYVREDDHLWLHLARPNPIWAALEENPTVLLSVAGDWAYVPTAWKAVDDEDPSLGIPTTYYAAVQLTCSAAVIDEPEAKLELLRRQLRSLQPEIDAADPSAHYRRLSQIRGLRLDIHEVRAKFKYGGNVDVEHRLAVADRLATRDGPGDAAARGHLLRRTDQGSPSL